MKKYFVAFTALAALLSCERNTETRGPSAEDLFGDLTVLEGLSVNDTVVDFSAGESLTFEARFNLNPNWELEIIGLRSGARKVISGQSRTLSDNGAVWDGSSTDLPLFKQEACLAVLKTPNAEGIPNDTLRGLRVIGSKVFNNFVVSDFEEGLNPGSDIFLQSGADMRFDTVQDITGPQGLAYYEFSGTVNFAPDLGNIVIPKTSFTDSNFILSTIPENVYFNVFAQKGGQSVNDLIVFQFFEDDNDNGEFDESQDDLYQFVISGLSQDWELLNVKYSDTENESLAGNGQKNPDKIIGMRILPIGLEEPFEGFIDYMNFTENGPLEL
jgi:hypothetical protein